MYKCFNCNKELKDEQIKAVSAYVASPGFPQR
jgi:DNA-directed RNA polymerase subunit RPC12/RpoP